MGYSNSAHALLTVGELVCAGAGSQSSNAAIIGAEDGADAIYQDSHTAPEFGYIFGRSDGLAPSTDYIAVLHFAGDTPHP